MIITPKVVVIVMYWQVLKFRWDETFVLRCTQNFHEYYIPLQNLPRSLASSTRITSLSKFLGDRLITDQTVLRSVLHASLWNTITILVSGRYFGYFLFLQPSSLTSFNERFNDIMSLAMRLNWFSLNSSCCLASFSGGIRTADPNSPGLPLFSLIDFAGRHNCSSDCAYRRRPFAGDTSACNSSTCAWFSSVSDCLFSVQPHPVPPMQSE